MDGESLMQDGVNFRVALYAWSVEELSSEIARLGQGARPAAGDSRGSRLP
jgi:hypothetical protein